MEDQTEQIFDCLKLLNDNMKEDDNDFKMFIEWKGIINLTTEFL